MLSLMLKFLTCCYSVPISCFKKPQENRSSNQFCIAYLNFDTSAQLMHRLTWGF
ncbi:hypothetical protein M758_5G169000 [Ceratodon purpureus]|uniref:Uncharacterized protein n=1 Tax=Ceratodon purpureus TaxID=3225 RepID=A0A8T0I579_CERPU|nr:hypothetical protein KC19_5G176300 [Ceratodon purpureus]KAG0617160.1 hypothetical protein M758_5G169000 [Ceratodon purpureus]